MKKILILASVFLFTLGAIHYMHNSLFYTFNPTVKTEKQSTKVTHKELILKKYTFDPTKSYETIKKTRYLYEGNYFYVTKKLIDTLPDEFHSYSNGM